MMRPSTVAPALTIKTLAGKTWSLSEQKPNKFTMVVFYRGDHCPICRDYLTDLAARLDDFKNLGVSNVIAVSGDTEELAKKTQSENRLGELTLGFNFDPKSMVNWGLFISNSIKDEEPKYFSEPGLFLIDSDGKLFFCSTSSLPFARPQFDDLLDGLKVVALEDYPRRGTIAYKEIDKVGQVEEKDQVEWSSEIEMADNHIINEPEVEKPTPKLK